jgi:hypothetical protein
MPDRSAELPVRIGKAPEPMMHGDEKSDPAVVAGKRANEAVSAAEEPVEPRAGAKGNAGGQSTHRPQGRASVSQALERVRTKARERKDETFTALLHHINEGHTMRSTRSAWRSTPGR